MCVFQRCPTRISWSAALTSTASKAFDATTAWRPRHRTRSRQSHWSRSLIDRPHLVLVLMDQRLLLGDIRKVPSQGVRSNSKSASIQKMVSATTFSDDAFYLQISNQRNSKFHLFVQKRPESESIQRIRLFSKNQNSIC